MLIFLLLCSQEKITCTVVEKLAELRRESRIFETSAQTLAGVRDAVDFTVAAAKTFAAARAL